MTNQEILKIAMGQSAIDANCSEEDFLKMTIRLLYLL